MKYSGKDVQAALDLYRATMLSTREVARRLGLGRQSVADWVKAAGLSRARNDSRQHASSLRAEAIKRYCEHEQSSIQVARDLDLPIGTVKNWLREAGVTRTASAAQSLNLKHDRVVAARVWAMREAGKQYAEIEAETGIPKGTISGLVRRHEALRNRRKPHRLLGLPHREAERLD